MNKYDVIVIGAGPGGYVAAIRAAQLGGKVLLIEKDKIGGICLNWGCIPTKAILASTTLFNKIKKSERYGITLSDPRIDFKKVIERKDRIVNKLVKGIEFLLKKNNVQVIPGEAKLLEDGKVEISKVDNSKSIVESGKIILATGSSPTPIPGIKFDKTKFLCSDDMFTFSENIPEVLNIIGGGVIGIHFAEIYSSLGCQVTIYEALPEILTGFDIEIIKFAKDILKRKKVIINTNTRFEKDKASGTNMICVGRTPNSFGINVSVNERMETAIPNVYAVGDMTGIKMLAHVASAQGIVAAENAMGQNSKIDYNAIPITIYTHPEIATIGLTEEAAKKYFEVNVGKFPFSALGHANALGEIEGFIKIISDKSNKKILGVHIAGPQAGTLIGIASVMLSNNMTIEDLIKTIFAHPSLSEGLFEAGLNALGRGIHF